MHNYDQEVYQAAEWLLAADGLLVSAGAGMGVDSGLPDFRGQQGFWRAYPALRASNIDFQDIANGMAFVDQPRLAWGFYGHRLALYRETVPHQGFQILLDLGKRLRHGAFVYTSNVDGQFQKAGFADEWIVECHGSIHHLQCAAACTTQIWPADELAVRVDERSCRFAGPLPGCPHCGKLARPNILMFNDWSWLSDRTEQQQSRLDAWLEQVSQPVIIELGAGTAIPSVRRRGESLGAPLIRINPREHRVPQGKAVGIPLGALAGLQALQEGLALLD